MFRRTMIVTKSALLLLLTLLSVVSVIAQESSKARTKPTPSPESKAPLFTLRGGLAFKPGYVPRKEESDLLKGQALVLKDKSSGAVLGRAVTDANGNFEFQNVIGTNSANPMVTKQVCNEKGDCFDFQPLKPDDPGPLKPIDVEDPVLQPMKREGSKTPPLIFRDISCTAQTGGQPVILKVKAGYDLKANKRL